MVRTLAFYPYFIRYDVLQTEGICLLKRKQNAVPPTAAPYSAPCGKDGTTPGWRARSRTVFPLLLRRQPMGAHPFPSLFSAPIITGLAGKSSIFPVFFGNNFSGGARRRPAPPLAGQREAILNISEKYCPFSLFYSCISIPVALQYKPVLTM